MQKALLTGLLLASWSVLFVLFTQEWFYSTLLPTIIFWEHKTAHRVTYWGWHRGSHIEVTLDRVPGWLWEVGWGTWLGDTGWHRVKQGGDIQGILETMSSRLCNPLHLEKTHSYQWLLTVALLTTIKHTVTIALLITFEHTTLHCWEGVVGFR